MVQKKWGRWLLSLLAIAGMAWLVWVLMQPQPVRVELSNCVRGSLRETVEAEGRTRVRDRYVIAAPVSGRLSRIALTRGDSVTRGQILARIDSIPLAPLDPRQSAEASARVISAENLHLQSEALTAHITEDCAQSQRELERAEHLVESGDIPRQDFERAKTAFNTCRKELEAAKFKAQAAAADVRAARAMLLALDQQSQNKPATAVSVSAPENGKVLKVLEESERVVTVGTPLIEISNTSNLEVVIDALSTDAVKVIPGSPVLVEGWGGDHALLARVRTVEPAAFTKVSSLGIEEQRVYIVADLMDPPRNLGDGFKLEAKIITFEKSGLLKVPIGAVYREGNDWYAFAAVNGKAERFKVSPGHRNSEEVEILEGLKEGTRVILHPPPSLRAGLPVTAN